MEREVIIGLVGRKHSGKDSIFECAVELLGAGVAQRFAFGDLLKAEFAARMGVTVEYINANKASFRGGLQWYGTEYRRNLFGADYWIKQLENSNAWRARSHTGVTFITDVRFLNEAQFVLTRGGGLVHVERPGSDEDEHQSESEQDQIACDYYVKNDQGLSFLKLIVGDWLPYIMARARARLASLNGDVSL